MSAPISATPFILRADMLTLSAVAMVANLESVIVPLAISPSTITPAVIAATLVTF